MSTNLNSNSIPTGLINVVWKNISSQRKRQLIGLSFIVFLAAFSELLSIGAVIPFLAVITAPSKILENSFAQYIFTSLHLERAQDLVLPLAIFFGFASILAGFIRLIFLKLSTHLSYAIGADLSYKIYKKILQQPYKVQISRNSSQVIDVLAGKISVAMSSFNSLLVMLSSIIMFVVILSTLFWVNPITSMIAILGFGLIYLVVVVVTRKKLSANSERISQESVAVVKTLQEGMWGIRDILIDGSQSAYCEMYDGVNMRLRQAQAENTFLTQSPRYATEALGMALIALIAYLLVDHSTPDFDHNAIPMLGLLALGAQRLLPVMQGIYSSWANIRSGESSLREIHYFLSQPDNPEYQNLVQLPFLFLKDIEVKNISFQYELSGPVILNDLSFKITKGDRIGIVGQTGSGKSTLLDILMGLIEPTKGYLSVDGATVTSKNVASWYKNIAHVPQTIFLADCSILQNIAFGIPVESIDLEIVKRAAKQAQISDLIEGWPDQYETNVGERGVRLSGGQRQRVGIARALYKNASVIFFDEATSALDNNTEDAVMSSIEALDKNLTIFIVAHRLSTLKSCNKIIEIKAGQIYSIESSLITTG